MATVDEMIRLMEAMATHRVGLVEFEGVKMMLAPPERAAQTAASGIAPPPSTPPKSDVNPNQAFQAIEAARKKAQLEAQNKLGAAQTRTARAREKAAGGITGGVGKAVMGLYEAAKSVPPMAPAPVVVVVETPVQESAPETNDA